MVVGMVTVVVTMVAVGNDGDGGDWSFGGICSGSDFLVETGYHAFFIRKITVCKWDYSRALLIRDAYHLFSWPRSVHHICRGTLALFGQFSTLRVLREHVFPLLGHW